MHTVDETSRCCDNHSSWDELRDHLVARFPGVPATDVLSELNIARAAAERFGMEAADQLETAEMIVRNSLLIRTGRIPDIARLDPETHLKRRTTETE